MPKSKAQVQRDYRRRRDAQLEAIIEAERRQFARERRLATRGTPHPDGFELRIGRAQDQLANIADDSVALILTDPPYAREADPLFAWLAQFAARVLIPGGSLVCYTGMIRLARDMRLFEDMGLQFHALLTEPLKDAPRLSTYRAIPWHTKGACRAFRMPHLLSATMGRLSADKELHAGGQSSAGIVDIVEKLTAPGDLVLDPFCGSDEWGHVIAGLRRRWIGCDIEEGGSTEIMT